MDPRISRSAPAGCRVDCGDILFIKTSNLGQSQHQCYWSKRWPPSTHDWSVCAINVDICFECHVKDDLLAYMCACVRACVHVCSHLERPSLQSPDLAVRHNCCQCVLGPSARCPPPAVVHLTPCLVVYSLMILFITPQWLPSLACHRTMTTPHTALHDCIIVSWWVT